MQQQQHAAALAKAQAQLQAQRQQVLQNSSLTPQQQAQLLQAQKLQAQKQAAQAQQQANSPNNHPEVYIFARMLAVLPETVEYLAKSPHFPLFDQFLDYILNSTIKEVRASHSLLPLHYLAESSYSTKVLEKIE